MIYNYELDEVRDNIKEVVFAGLNMQGFSEFLNECVNGEHPLDNMTAVFKVNKCDIVDSRTYEQMREAYADVCAGSDIESLMNEKAYYEDLDKEAIDDDIREDELYEIDEAIETWEREYEDFSIDEWLGDVLFEGVEYYGDYYIKEPICVKNMKMNMDEIIVAFIDKK